MAKITNKQLAACFTRYLNEKWGYVYGAQGEQYTKSLAEKWKREGRSVPGSSWDKETYFTEDCAKWFGHRVADCSGGIVCAIREYDKDFVDRTANTFKRQFTESGTIDTLPEIVGLALWKSGHIGVYVGGGYAIEFRGTTFGCIETRVVDRPWTHWGKIQGVTYDEEAKKTTTCSVELPVLRKGDNNHSVAVFQTLLNAYGYNCGGVDCIFGTKTEKATMSFQSAHNLTADGICGAKTWAVLLK